MHPGRLQELQELLPPMLTRINARFAKTLKKCFFLCETGKWKGVSNLIGHFEERDDSERIKKKSILNLVSEKNFL